MDWIVGFCIKEQECLGVRYISVDAYSSAEKFYEKNFFKKIDNNRNNTIIYMARDLNKN